MRCVEPQALSLRSISPAWSVEEPVPQSINPYMVAVTTRESTFPTSVHVGISPRTSTEGGTPDSFDDVEGALENECTPARDSQYLKDVGLGPDFSIPRGQSAQTSSRQPTAGLMSRSRRPANDVW